jgi:hypothetical protein
MALSLSRVLKPHPGFDILMEEFLGFDAFGDEHERPAWQESAEQRREKALSAATHAGDRQCAALLQPRKEGFDSGSCRGKVKEIEASRTCRMSNQL